MKNVFGLVLLLSFTGYSQGKMGDYTVEAQYFRGNIYKHSGYISHLITGHPEGVLLSFNRKTFGEKPWQSLYNFPDYGLSLHYQDFKNEHLGEAFAVGVYYNFYFLNRHLRFRISQGLGYTTNPYDKITNYQNIAFGSRLLSSNLFLLDFKKQNIYEGFGVEAGLMFNHFSNGRIKSPNGGINTYAATIGVNYDLDPEKKPLPINDSIVNSKFTEPIRYSIYLRSGVSESQVPESGQLPFYHISLAVDKRIGQKSALQLGVDVFFSQYLKKYIKYVSVAFPEKPYVDPNTDYKRIGVVAGHEMFIGKFSLETQFGVYVYRPFNYESRVYERLGLKYYLTKKILTGMALKAHGGRAEAVEFGIGVRI